ncbi:MAG: hypothetical protein AAFW73_11760 [Bacteroidota bacterium]
MSHLILLIQNELLVPLDTSAELSFVLIGKLAAVLFIVGMLFLLEYSARSTEHKGFKQ